MYNNLLNRNNVILLHVYYKLNCSVSRIKQRLIGLETILRVNTFTVLMLDQTKSYLTNKSLTLTFFQ